MNLLKTIVVGVDFTPGCAAALREACRIAEWGNAGLRPVHVIDTHVAEELEAALGGKQSNVREQLVEDARRAWTSFAEGVKCSTTAELEVRIDNLVRGLLSAVTDAAADLLVVGAFASRHEDAGAGSVAIACVRHARSKVLLVPESQVGAFKNVVACVDFSETSLIALDQAARVATQDSAALHVLHVFSAPWRRLHYRAPTRETSPEFQIQYRQGLERRLRAFSGLLGREIDYLKPTYALFEYDGHRSGIAEYATKNGADLIVLGTQGKTNLRDVLLGSTAEKTLRETRCSVLAVRPEPMAGSQAAASNL